MQNEEYVLNNKCPSCGANIKFNPQSGKFDCEYCKSSFTIDEMKEHNNASSDKNNEDYEEDVHYDVYKCKTCGAEIVCDEQTAATFCIYCRNTAIIKSKLSNEFKPTKIIPFKKTKKDAQDAFRRVAKGKPLAPKDFTNSNIEQIRGIYIPFWLYDIDTSGDLDCSATKVRSWTVGDTRYTETKRYMLYRNADINFYKVPVDGSTRFDNAVMNSIEPFKYEDLVDYNHAYLAGFYAERYDVESNACYPEAEARALLSTKNAMFADSIGYSSKQITKNTITATNKNTEYVLLPVWMVNVVYKGKKYTFAMNAQTGKFIGNVPISKKKFIFYMLLTFTITALIILLFSYLIFKGVNA